MGSLSIRLRLLGQLTSLRFRISSIDWMVNSFFVVILPISTLVWALGPAMSAPERARVALGCLVFGSILVGVRFLSQEAGRDAWRGTGEILSTLPIDPHLLLTSHVLNAVSLLGIQLAIWSGFVAVFEPDSAPRGFLWLVPHLFGSVSFVAVGVLIGSSIHGPSMAPNTVSALLIAISPLLYLPDRVPTWVAPVVELAPPALVIDAMFSVWRNGDVATESMALVAAWAVVLVGLAWWRARVNSSGDW